MERMLAKRVTKRKEMNVELKEIVYEQQMEEHVGGCKTDKGQREALFKEIKRAR